MALDLGLLTLASAFDAVSNTDSLAVVEILYLLDTKVFVGVVLEVRHGQE